MKRKHSQKDPFRQNRILRLLLAPYLFGLFRLVLLPSLLALGLAFTRYDALTPPAWNGLSLSSPAYNLLETGRRLLVDSIWLVRCCFCGLSRSISYLANPFSTISLTATDSLIDAWLYPASISSSIQIMNGRQVYR